MSGLHFLLKNISVIISRNHTIFRNLALEDWLYRNVKKKLLFLWRNNVCVVIGRHQNPWTEINLATCNSLNIPIARRNSGGGTVIHDLNNLNICFVSDKKSYNRRKNMTFIKDVLKNKFNIDCTICKRDNLFLKDTGFKVSGTASKIGLETCYHHATLLVNVDLSLMGKLIKATTQNCIKSKATESIRSTVENLDNINKDLNIDSLTNHLAHSYIQAFSNGDIISIDPTEKHFYGIDVIDENFRKWEWIYGKTPKFIVENNDEKILVINGYIKEIESKRNISCNLRNALIGMRFDYKLIKHCLSNFNGNDEEQKMKICILDLIGKAY